MQVLAFKSFCLLSPRKYEEIYPPEVEEFVYITDDTYTKKQLLRMEHLLLKVLAFDLTVPTINQFLFQYLQRHGVCLKTENFARVGYLLSVSRCSSRNKIDLAPVLIARLLWIHSLEYSVRTVT